MILNETLVVDWLDFGVVDDELSPGWVDILILTILSLIVIVNIMQY